MTGRDVQSLIALGESQTLEFKTSFERETIETLVAFANARGGVVIVGVADDAEQAIELNLLTGQVLGEPAWGSGFD